MRCSITVVQVQTCCEACVCGLCSPCACVGEQTLHPTVKLTGHWPVHKSLTDRRLSLTELQPLVHVFRAWLCIYYSSARLYLKIGTSTLLLILLLVSKIVLNTNLFKSEQTQVHCRRERWQRFLVVSFAHHSSCGLRDVTVIPERLLCLFIY